MTDSPDQTLALARTAAGAVRSLNHATLGGEGLAQPADAYELIGELALAAVAFIAQPRPFGTPVELFGLPDIGAAAGEAEGLEPHRVEGDVAGEDH